MNIFFLSCLKATELIEKKFHVRLSVKEKLQLRFHKMMCDACSAYDKQSELLEKGIARGLQNIRDTHDVEDLKKAINERISNNN